MENSFTQGTVDQFFDLLEMENAEIFEDIKSMAPDTPAEKWKEKLIGIAQQNALSSRFALMRILAARAVGNPAGQSTNDICYTAQVGDHTETFQDISLGHAGSMSMEESHSYISYLSEMASRQENSDPDVFQPLILRAWFDREGAEEYERFQRSVHSQSGEKSTGKKALYKTRLNREESLLLGHYLNFSLQEMQWFLTRVFDADEGLRMNNSADLIHAWCFLTNAGAEKADVLLERYSKASAGIPKVDDDSRKHSWTQNMSDSLFSHAETWMRNLDTMDEDFFAWLLSNAPGLDIPSRTAGRIYRNLAAFACDLIDGEQLVPSEDEFMDCIQDVYEEPDESGASLRRFFREGKPDEQLCKAAADQLLLENKVQSSSTQADNTKAWHIIMTKEDGKLTASGGIVNKSRRRIVDLLLGLEPVQKGDMLYLLWFTANLIWQYGEQIQPNLLCSRMLDFMDTASYLLQEAGLPEFYPPHVLEQSMMLAIIGSSEEDGDPSVIYEAMLSTLTEHRVRKQGSERHSTEMKLEIVRFYRSHPELSLDECAKQFDISPKSISAWQKQFQDAGML